jgi:hypothetical protein
MWKLHLTTPPQLYCLDADVGETTDLAQRHPEVVERLLRIADAIRRETVPHLDP